MAGDQLASKNGPWDDDTVNYTYDPGSRQRSGMSIAAPNASAWTFPKNPNRSKSAKVGLAF